MIRARKPYKNLIGNRYGKLTVVKWTGKWQGSQSIWLCKCDCGGEKEVPIYSLTGGVTKSCGCLVRDKHRNRIEGKRFGRLLAIKPTGERVGEVIVWECLCDCGEKAYIRSSNLLSGDTMSCGCLKREQELKAIKSARKNAHVDDTVPGRIQSIYDGKESTTNSSGVVGVTWHKRVKKWQARIAFQKKAYNLGYFDKMEEAIAARKEAEEKYFGSYLERASGK